MVHQLFQHWYASRAYLQGRVAQPDEGCTPEELVARVDLPFWQARQTPELVERLMPRDLAWVAQGQEDLPADVADEDND